MYWHQIEIREIRETFLKTIKKMMSYGSALNRNWDYKKQLLKLSDEFASNQIKSQIDILGIRERQSILNLYLWFL